MTRWFWLVAAVLTCGACSAVDTTPTPVRPWNIQVTDGARTDGTTDGANEASTDVPPNDVTDVPSDLLGDVLVMDTNFADLVDGGERPDVVDVVDVMDSADVVDGTLPVDVADATSDVQPDWPDVVLIDVVDVSLPDSAPEAGPDVPIVDMPMDVNPCSTGRARCEDMCVDLQTSMDNCGVCGNVCMPRANAATLCTSGACGLGACNTGFSNCDGNVVNGCEVDTRTSVTNCGSCGGACPTRTNATSACTASACEFTCNSGFGNCDSSVANGCETNTNTSATNCGACGNVCTSGVCEGGVCLPNPTLDVAYANASIAGLWVRTADYRNGNPVGTWAWSPCSLTSPVRICRIDLRRLTIPGAGTLVTTWSEDWGLEIMAMTSMTNPLCPIGVGRDCPGCGMDTAFSCLRVTCTATGGASAGLPRYEQAYRNVLPPGVSGSGTLYVSRVGFLDSPHPPICPRAPGS